MFRSPFDDDPLFQNPLAEMHEMMGGHARPMGMLSPMMGQPQYHHSARGQRYAQHDAMALSPFGMMDGMFGRSMFGGSLFGGMGSMMRNMEQSMRLAESNGGMPGSSFHSSYTSISYGGGDGQPKVYRSSSSTKVGPGGVKETKKTEENSETGLRKMAIGHHIDDRAHVIEKAHNSKTGDNEESQEFINLDEDDAGKFDEEFKRRVRSSSSLHRGRLMGHPVGRHSPYPPREPAAIEYHRPPGTFRPHRHSGHSRSERR